MPELSVITPEVVLSWEPCPRYTNPTQPNYLHLPGLPPLSPLELTDLRRIPAVPPEDRLWVLLRTEVLAEKTLRLIACDCVERTLRRERAAGREPDPWSWLAVEVARRYARGEATKQELAAARDAALVAGAATWDATRAVAWAVGAAARAAAGAAAWAAEQDATLAAWATARAAAEAAAWAATLAAWATAAAAAGAAAAADERRWQLRRVRHYLNQADREDGDG